MKNFIHKSAKLGYDAYPNLSSIQRQVEFFRSRGKLTIEKHNEIINSLKIK